MTLLRSIVPGFGRLTPATPSSTTPTPEARLKPVFQVREDEHGYDVSVDLPGVAKAGLEITSLAGQLTIIGRRAWVAPAEWSALYRETRRADFELNLTHENDVEVDKISAEMKDGILRLTLPKAEAVKPRKIAVN